jgi:hypothetical protein
MTKASDNPFPYMRYVEGTTPSNPAAGSQRLFVRSSDHVLCMVDSTGAVTALSGSLTNPMSAVGDVIQGTTAGAPARLAAPLTGKVLTGAGLTTPLVYAYPPGYELDYVEFTSAVTVSATAEATPTNVVVGSSVAYDGSTAVIIEFFSTNVRPGTTAGDLVELILYDGTSSIGILALIRTPASSNDDVPVLIRRKLTPSNASHTYKIGGIKSGGNATVSGGIGGVGVGMPGYIRITKA